MVEQVEKDALVDKLVDLISRGVSFADAIRSLPEARYLWEWAIYEVVNLSYLRAGRKFIHTRRLCGWLKKLNVVVDDKEALRRVIERRVKLLREMAEGRVVIAREDDHSFIFRNDRGERYQLFDSGFLVYLGKPERKLGRKKPRKIVDAQ